MSIESAKPISVANNPRHGLVDHFSSPEAKIALFRSLFRGRDDVYPRRFESRKTGKSGYQPACANEWVAACARSPRSSAPPARIAAFFPSPIEVIRWHLSGQDDAGRDFVMGVYPMLQDETCFFLAADFDKTHWQEDARAILETCRRMNLPAALERSRSGNGGHVWLFFEEAIPGALGTQTRFAHPDRDHGTPAGYRLGFLRPFLPQSRHAAPRRFWQSDRLAAAEAAAGTRQ